MSARGDAIWRGIALLGLATGTAALVGTLLLWNRLATRAPETRIAAPRAPSAPSSGPLALAGRTGVLSRISPERRAVLRIQLTFGANGALDIACRAEGADGGESACFEREKGTGTWSLSAARLCVTAEALKLAPDSCYALSGETPNLVLAGPGILAGNMMLR